MPLAMMTPEMAQSLVSIGLPYGPNTKRPDAATQSQELSAQLAANPQTNGSQQPVQIDPGAQQASQQDAAAIFSGSQPAPGQAARLQAAQAAVQPSQAPPMNVLGDAAMPLPEGATPTREQAVNGNPIRALGNAIAPVLVDANAPPDSATARLQAAQAASDSAASGPSPQVAPGAPTGAPLQPGGPPVATVARDANGLPVPAGDPAGAPQAPQATTPPATAQTPPVAPPAPAGGVVGPAQGPVAAPSAPTAPAAAPAGRYSPSEIQAALIKAGVPAADAATLTAVSGAESGYGANPVSPKNKNGTTDYGLFQINSSHADLNPSSLVNADLDTQAKAAAAVYQKEGLGAWTTFNNGAYKQYASSGDGKGQFTGATTSNTDYAPAHAQADGSAIGIDPAEMMKLATALGYKPLDQNAADNRNLIAMGLGMMGGRTYADSMKNAAGIMSEGNNAMLGLQEHQNSNALSLAQTGINARRADAQLAMERARLVAMDRDRPVGPITQQPDGTWGMTMLHPPDNSTYVRQTGSPASFANSDPTRKASGALLTTQLRDNDKTIRDYADPHIQTQAQSVIRQANELQELIQRNHNVIGGDITSKFNRYLANITGANLNGLDPNDLSTASKLINQTNTNGIFGQTHGNLQRVTGQEFQKIGGGQVNFDTQPGAALALLEANKQDAQTALAVSSKLNGLSEIDRAHYVSQPGGVDRLINDTLAEINAKRGPTDFKNSPTGVQPVKGVQNQEQPAYTPSGAISGKTSTGVGFTLSP